MRNSLKQRQENARIEAVVGAVAFDDLRRPVLPVLERLEHAGLLIKERLDVEAAGRLGRRRMRRRVSNVGPNGIDEACRKGDYQNGGEKPTPDRERKTHVHRLKTRGD